MPIDCHLPQADPFSLVPTFKTPKILKGKTKNPKLLTPSKNLEVKISWDPPFVVCAVWKSKAILMNLRRFPSLSCLEETQRRVAWDLTSETSIQLRFLPFPKGSRVFLPIQCRAGHRSRFCKGFLLRGRVF